MSFVLNKKRGEGGKRGKREFFFFFFMGLVEGGIIFSFSFLDIFFIIVVLLRLMEESHGKIHTVPLLYFRLADYHYHY